MDESFDARASIERIGTADTHPVTPSPSVGTHRDDASAILPGPGVPGCVGDRRRRTPADVRMRKRIRMLHSHAFIARASGKLADGHRLERSSARRRARDGVPGPPEASTGVRRIGPATGSPRRSAVSREDQLSWGADIGRVGLRLLSQDSTSAQQRVRFQRRKFSGLPQRVNARGQRASPGDFGTRGGPYGSVQAASAGARGRFSQRGRRLPSGLCSPAGRASSAHSR